MSIDERRYVYRSKYCKNKRCQIVTIAEIWEKVQDDVDFQDMLQHLIELYGSEMTERKTDMFVNLFVECE